MARLSDGFNRMAQWTAEQAGHPTTFALAVAAIVVWGLSGPLFGYSDTWQLVINTGTTIVTFLMVFLIQNTQNRDTQALQLKIDELIRANESARNRLLRLEEMSEAEVQRVKDAFLRLARDDGVIADEAESDIRQATGTARTAA
ncbi:MAG: low affinity iron permease family protein [Geminicoccaceae bacterium]